ncbi:hypothetical protein C7N43_05505 [Sphingobacteriales bacterium UPWRP_1]|nr:hypothetical protein BVG80_06380 [Sphingobacteriales bacterium TSM_CSM]PSJ78035.1 hypothetical protein C7N43_05505 [Sphingobacteriales bacterium UPWRP_1]
MRFSFVMLIAALFTGLTVWSGCSSETEDLNLDYGYAYFPIDSGYWITYEVDSVLYSTFLTQGVDTVHAEVKELFSTPFTDNEGRQAITIERYTRYSDTIAWENIIPTVWYAVKDSQQAERMEGELRFQNMVFPVLDGLKWYGNAHINTNQDNTTNYAGWQYQYQQTGTPQTVNGFTFNQTTTVLQNDYEDLVTKIYSREVYARNVGMIEKERWILQLGSNDITSPLPWPQRAQRGFIVTMRITGYKQ